MNMDENLVLAAYVNILYYIIGMNHQFRHHFARTCAGSLLTLEMTFTLAFTAALGDASWQMRASDGKQKWVVLC